MFLEISFWYLVNTCQQLVKHESYPQILLQWIQQQQYVTFIYIRLQLVLWLLGLDVTGLLITEIIHQIKAWRYSFSGKHVVITGGSSGLGLELAKRIAAESAKVTIVARKIKLLETAKEEIIAYCKNKGIMTPHIDIAVADVCNKDDIQSTIEKDVKNNGVVDVIICNAGMAKTGYVTIFQ